MITLAEPKIPKGNNMIILGFNFLLYTSQSLTPQRFQTLSQGDHLSVGIRLHNQAAFPKVIKCLPLSMLVITFAREGTKSTRDCVADRHEGMGRIHRWRMYGILPTLPPCNIANKESL